MLYTITEFECLRDELLDLFACAEFDDMQRAIWLVKRPISKAQADRIWLWIFAVNTWEHTDGALNYMTEAQMMRILSQANTIMR